MIQTSQKTNYVNDKDQSKNKLCKR